MASVTMGISPTFVSNMHSESAYRYHTGGSSTYKSTSNSSYSANVTSSGKKPNANYEVSNLTSSQRFGGSLSSLNEERYIKSRVQDLVDTSYATPSRHSYIHERESTPKRSFARSEDRYNGRSVHPDVMKEISRDLKRSDTSKVSRFQKTFAPQAIKRKVEEVFTRKAKAESLVTPNIKDRSYSKDDLNRGYEYFDYHTKKYDDVGRLSKSNVVSPDEADLVNKVLQRASCDYSEYKGSNYSSPHIKRASGDFSDYKVSNYSSTPIKRTSGDFSDYKVSNYSPSPIRTTLKGSSCSPIIPRKTPRLLTNSDHIQFNRNEKDVSLIKGFESSNLNFIPDSVNVTVLPNGEKAIEYSSSTQSGSGDQKEANALIERIVQKTKIMQQSMTSLEDFVRRNRRLFPEETQIFQRIRFFQLTDEQLKEIGEKPGAEVYGVKITEKLVVPRGTDIRVLLSKYYGNEEVNVCYKGSGDSIYIKDDGLKSKHLKVENNREDYSQYLKRNIREKIIDESAKPVNTSNKFSKEIETADHHLKHHDTYNHLHPYVSGAYIKSIYSDSGLNYDDIYTPGKTSYASSVTSDRESVRSGRSSSRRSAKKRFDTTPSFTSTLRPKSCIVSQHIRFNCSVTGLPLPDVTWTKGNRILSDGPRIKITNNYGLLSLEITDVHVEDAGNYTVSISNLEGESSCCATLQVTDIHIGDFNKVAQKPYFISDATNTFAEVGGKATFEIQAGGNPIPNFKWTKDAFTLEDNDHFRIFMDDRGNSKLVIHNVCETDAGLYCCIASSKTGQVKTNASLNVVPRGQLSGKSRETTPTGSRRSFSKERTPKAFQEPIPEGTKPYFMKLPPNIINVKEGDPIFATCIIDGDPKPKVTWMKGARELSYTQRMRVMVSGDHYTLNMKAALQTDPGQYTCVATNRCGTTNTNVWINVLPRGKDEPEDWELTRYKMEESDAYVEKVRTTKTENVAPKFVRKLPKETEIIEGDDFVIDCDVTEGAPKESVQHEYRIIESKGIKVKEEKVRISTKIGDEDATVLESKVIIDTKRVFPNAIEQEQFDAPIDINKSSQNDGGAKIVPDIVDEIAEIKESVAKASYAEPIDVVPETNNKDNIQETKPIIEEQKISEVESAIINEPQQLTDVPSQETSEPKASPDVITEVASQPDLIEEEQISVKSDEKVEETPVNAVENVEQSELPKDDTIETSSSPAAEEKNKDETDAPKQDISNEKNVCEETIEPESVVPIREAMPFKEDIKAVREDSIDNAVALMETIPEDERVAVLEELIAVSNNEVTCDAPENIATDNIVAEEEPKEVQSCEATVTEMPTQDPEVIA